MSKIDDVTVIHVEHCTLPDDDIIFGLDDTGRYVYSRRHCLDNPAQRHDLLGTIRLVLFGASRDGDYWIPHKRLAEAVGKYFGETTWDAYQVLVALENA